MRANPVGKIVFTPPVPRAPEEAGSTTPKKELEKKLDDDIVRLRASFAITSPNPVQSRGVERLFPRSDK